MKTFIKILPLIFLFLINNSCNDEPDEYVYKFLGNYTFEIISSEGKIGLTNTDTTYYDGLIRTYKKQDGDDYYKYSGDGGGIITHNKITIQYQKDKYITFQVLETGEFTTGYSDNYNSRWGGFTSKDTVEFYTNYHPAGSGSYSYVTRVIGVRK